MGLERIFHGCLVYYVHARGYADSAECCTRLRSLDVDAMKNYVHGLFQRCLFEDWCVIFGWEEEKTSGLSEKKFISSRKNLNHRNLVNEKLKDFEGNDLDGNKINRRVDHQIFRA